MSHEHYRRFRIVTYATIGLGCQPTNEGLTEQPGNQPSIRRSRTGLRLAIISSVRADSVIHSGAFLEGNNEIPRVQDRRRGSIRCFYRQCGLFRLSRNAGTGPALAFPGVQFVAGFGHPRSPGRQMPRSRRRRAHHRRGQEIAPVHERIKEVSQNNLGIFPWASGRSKLTREPKQIDAQLGKQTGAELSALFVRRSLVPPSNL